MSTALLDPNRFADIRRSLIEHGTEDMQAGSCSMKASNIARALGVEKPFGEDGKSGVRIGYTPGPWLARDYKTDDGDIWIDCDSWKNRKTASCRGGTLATVHASGTGEGTIEANARLIAAAPDLLAECERLLGVFERARVPGEITQTPEGVQQLRNAIAKAKGGAQ